MYVVERCVYYDLRRSREGAWIEICTQRIAQSLALVAPARERGLKSAGEQQNTIIPAVAPARERGLKSPIPGLREQPTNSVAPARERGLKYAHSV